MIQIDPTKFIVMKKTPISNDYNLIEQIGKGGFATVYKAW
jgi:hypothetical protein